MAEAVATRPSAAIIRVLFANLLVYNNVQDPRRMWLEFRDSMSEDFLHAARRLNPDRQYDAFIYQQALRDVAGLLSTMGAQQSLELYGLPVPDAEPLADVVVEELARYDAEKEADEADKMENSMNAEQRAVHRASVEAVESTVGKGAVFFVDGVVGAGKTYTYSAILHKVRGMGAVALPVATSGIAALLLAGGRTAHSRFKIPVPAYEDSYCFVSREEKLAQLLRAAKVSLGRGRDGPQVVFRGRR